MSPKKMTQAEIKTKIELHLKWLKGEKGGSRANLSWAHLSGANLTEAHLSGANLTGANLTGANLSGANLTEANLSWAHLSGANLTGANLTEAHLSGAILTGANLTEANLSWANLTGANLTGANLWITQWPLWCGTKKVKIDAKIAMQLAAHYCAVDCDDKEYQETRKAMIKFALKSHVAKELELEE